MGTDENFLEVKSLQKIWQQEKSGLPADSGFVSSFLEIE